MTRTSPCHAIVTPHLRRQGLLILAFGWCGLFAADVPVVQDGELRLPHIFGDHMVLQCERPVAIWGEAAPSAALAVEFAKQRKTAVADARGRWRVQLDAMPVSAESGVLTITAGPRRVQISDVLVGEVWVGSGQSNMAFTLNGCTTGKEAMAAATQPQIRLFKAATTPALTPQGDVNGQWMVCSPKAAGEFPAVLYFMGRDLHRDVKRPMGLIGSCWGGTVIQAWSRYDSLAGDTEAKTAAEAQAKQLDDPAWCQKEYDTQLAKYEKDLERFKDEPEKIKRLSKPSKHSPLEKNRASVLYNGMVSPLLGFGIRGVVWYQGEFNAGQYPLYERLLPKMIADWRDQWGVGEFPFLIVQLPSIGTDPQTQPVMPNAKWAGLRQAQLTTAQHVPNTGLVVSFDGLDHELHPRDKEPIGVRLALSARKLAYGQDLVWSGPLYRGMAISGDAIRLSFDHAAGGLKVHGTTLQGFAIAGEDRTWAWGEARIDGDAVVVRSAAVPHPLAVRYGWAENPLPPSLFNGAELPASPFRTDDWPATAK